MQEPGPDADVRASGEVPLVGADLEREFRGASALAGTALRSSRSPGQVPEQPTSWGSAGSTTPGSVGAGRAEAGRGGGALLCRELPRISVSEADGGDSSGVDGGKGQNLDEAIPYYDRPSAVSEAPELAGVCGPGEGSSGDKSGAAGRGGAEQHLANEDHELQSASAGQVEMKELACILAPLCGYLSVSVYESASLLLVPRWS